MHSFVLISLVSEGSVFHCTMSTQHSALTWRALSQWSLSTAMCPIMWHLMLVGLPSQNSFGSRLGVSKWLIGAPIVTKWSPNPSPRSPGLVEVTQEMQFFTTPCWPENG